MTRDECLLQATEILSEILPPDLTFTDIVKYASACIHFVERNGCCLEHSWPKFAANLRGCHAADVAKMLGDETARMAAEQAVVDNAVMEAHIDAKRRGVPFDEAKHREESEAYVRSHMLAGHDWLTALKAEGMHVPPGERPN